MKKETQKLKKMFAFGAVLVLYLALLTTCNDGQKKLSDGFGQGKIQEATIKVIDAVNAKDSDTLWGISDNTMRPTLTDDALTTVHKAIGEDGAFQEIKEVDIAGASNKNAKEDYAVAVARVQYEKKAFIYTISLTKDMKLTGLYYK